MAYAAYRELLGATVARAHEPRPQDSATWMVLDVTVHGRDAFRLRHALGTCADCAVLRCVPLLELLDDHRVRVELRLASHVIDEVMHRVLQCVPDGEIGHLMSWACHLHRQDQGRGKGGGRGHG